MRPTGDIKCLSCFTELEELNLSQTGVSGDVSGVAPLVKLTLLDLGTTSFSSNHEDLERFWNCGPDSESGRLQRE